MDPRQVRRLAEQSANFGFLKEHPLLVWYGAGAELLVYVDAQAAMFKIRAFGDELAKDLVRRTGARPFSSRTPRPARRSPVKWPSTDGARGRFAERTG
ncbi:hypothetical protein ACFYPH_07255 [Micromonospora sp. NPDC005252]|uniref:hypothetical protein n=1 Tax=Micromonospora sp. NPDC005252 TaxID=3364228 RepID=UPI00368FFAD0